MTRNADSLDAPARAQSRSPMSETAPATPPPRADQPAPRRGGGLLIVAAAVIIVAFIAGLLPRLRDRAIVRSDTQDLAVPTVAVVSPAPAAMEKPLTLSGELRPLTEAVILARANGYVRRWLVDLGAKVETGQLLAELDTPEIDRELLQARAELVRAEAARDLAATTAKRWREMLSGKTVSSQEADEKAADLQLKNAGVEAARANVQRLQDVAGFGKITAPFAGTITARKLDVGQLVNAGGGDELYRLAQLEKLRVFVRVPQTHARSVVIGQKAELTFTELPGKTFEATVVRTAGAVDAASRTLLVELEVDNAEGRMLAGSYAQVRLPDARPEPVLTLPANTLIFRSEGPQVVLAVNGRAELRDVRLGRDLGSLVEVLTGVGPTEQVILNPSDALVTGSEVKVVQPAAEKK